uniref:CAZy families GH13 protein n=1 Tax=uncultured Sebaldella sp. TaxID=1095919 RepID=A0A060C768_9FUSO|nr:CAZy families GH13 protein [uncultured Sebaldella sp.]
MVEDFYTDGDKVNDYFRFMNENVFSKINNCITLGEISSTTKEKSVQYSKKEMKNCIVYLLFDI